jgi:hypothetical protein
VPLDVDVESPFTEPVTVIVTVFPAPMALIAHDVAAQVTFESLLVSPVSVTNALCSSVTVSGSAGGP